MQPQMNQLNSMRMTTVKAAAEEQAAMAMTGVRYVADLVFHCLILYADSNPGALM
jgi:hypothetical protein